MVPRRPLDILNLAVAVALLGLAVLMAALGRPPGAWGWDIARRAGLVGAVLLVVWIERRSSRSRVGRVVVDFYPLAVIPEVFNGLQPLITAIGMPNRDAELAAIDRWMLGGVDATVVAARFIAPWLSDLLHLAYCAYFVFPIVVAGAMFRRSGEAGRRFIFTAALAFYVSYAGYFIVPARGPRFYQWPAGDMATRATPVSRTIYWLLDSYEKTKDDVFPSGHCMVTTVCLIAAWRFDRRVFWPLLPIGLALGAATVYCRFHYVIDVVAGVGLAFVTLPAGYAIYDRWARRREGGGQKAEGRNRS